MAKYYEVEWCPTEPPIDEHGDHDLYAAKYQTMIRPTEASAFEYAQGALLSDWFGEVRINEYRLVDSRDRSKDVVTRVGRVAHGDKEIQWESVEEPTDYL